MAPHEHGWRKYWWTSTPLLNLKIRKTLGMKGTGLFPNQHKPQLPTSCLLHSCIPNYILWYYVFLFLYQNIPKICCHRWNMLIRLKCECEEHRWMPFICWEPRRSGSLPPYSLVAWHWPDDASHPGPPKKAMWQSQDLEVAKELEAITYTFSIQM